MTLSLPTRYLGTIALTLLAGALIYLGAFLYQMGALVSAEYWLRDAQVVKQELLAEHQHQNKIIFAGGSSAFFGIDSQEVERQLGIPTLNLGLHIGRPVHFVLNEMVPYLTRGDIVVLPLEYEHYREATPYTDWFTNQIMSWHPEYFWQLNMTEKLKFVRSVLPQRVLVGVLTKLMGEHLERVRTRALKAPEDILNRVREAWHSRNYHPDKMFSFLNVTPHGDAIVSTPEPPLEYRGNPYQLDLDFVEPEYFWHTLQEFFAKAQAQGIHVYIAWPPTMKAKLDLTSPRLNNAVQAIANKVRQLGIPILGSPSEFQYSADLFTGSIYHLTAQGKAEHTHRLLDHMTREAVASSQLPHESLVTAH